MKKALHNPLACLAALALAALFFTPIAQAADNVKVNAVLIAGSNDGGGVDSSLRQYESKLKANIPKVDTFKRLGGGRADISLPGSKTMNLGSGQTVAVDVKPTSNGKLQITIEWKRGSQRLLKTIVESSKNNPNPTVLGAPGPGDGKYILLLFAN